MSHLLPDSEHSGGDADVTVLVDAIEENWVECSLPDNGGQPWCDRHHISASADKNWPSATTRTRTRNPAAAVILTPE